MYLLPQASGTIVCNDELVHILVLFFSGQPLSIMGIKIWSDDYKLNYIQGQVKINAVTPCEILIISSEKTGGDNFSISTSPDLLQENQSLLIEL